MGPCRLRLTDRGNAPDTGGLPVLPARINAAPLLVLELASDECVPSSSSFAGLILKLLGPPWLLSASLTAWLSPELDAAPAAASEASAVGAPEDGAPPSPAVAAPGTIASDAAGASPASSHVSSLPWAAECMTGAPAPNTGQPGCAPEGAAAERPRLGGLSLAGPRPPAWLPALPTVANLALPIPDPRCPCGGLPSASQLAKDWR